MRQPPKSSAWIIKEMRKAAARGFLATASRTFPNAILYMPPKECPFCSLSSIFIGGRRSTLTRNQLPATHRYKYLRRAITPRQSRRAAGSKQSASWTIFSPIGEKSRSHRGHEVDQTLSRSRCWMRSQCVPCQNSFPHFWHSKYWSSQRKVRGGIRS